MACSYRARCVDTRKTNNKSKSKSSGQECPPYFFAAASRWRKAAMVAAEGSLRLLFFGLRLVLVV